MFVLLVRFEVVPEHLAAFDALTERTLASIAALEPATITYTIHLRRDHPTERVFYEAYADHDAFLAHEAAEHTKAFLAERGRYLVGEPEVWWMTAIDGTTSRKAGGAPNAADAPNAPNAADAPNAAGASGSAATE